MLIECPACGCAHGFTIEGPHAWKWNGSVDLPTFSPSMLATWTDHPDGKTPVDRRCHSFVRDGRIQFLADCTHDLAGQTVDLPDAGS